MFESSPDIDRRKCLPNRYTFSRARIRGLQTRYIWIKENFRKPFSVEAAAAEARMSASALHLHFKAVTRFTHSLDAAATAFEVGYECPSQFSREYRRQFGIPPVTDGRRLRRDPAFEDA